MLLLILIISPNNSIEYITQQKWWPKLKELLKEYMSFFLFEAEKQQIKVSDRFLESVEKSQKCRTEALWFITLACEHCNHTKNLYLVCHNKLCTSCGKTSCVNRTTSANKRIPQHIKYIHITFTLPEELREFRLYFRDERVLNILFEAAKLTILQVMKQRYKCMPGFISVIHTFGSDLKRNPHIHMIVTAWWLTYSLDERIDLWGEEYFHYNFFKHTWRYFVTRLSRKFINNSHLNYKNKFNERIKTTFNKDRYVYVGEKMTSSKNTVKYVWRYLKRPPIAESRIVSVHLVPKKIHESTITIKYTHKKPKEIRYITMSIFDFLLRLSEHLPNKWFQCVRYGWMFAPKKKAFCLATLYLHTSNALKMSYTGFVAYIAFQTRMIESFWKDPFVCPCCNHTMIPVSITLPFLYWFKTMAYP